MSERSLILLLGMSLAAFAASGCTTESYCFEDCEGETGGTAGTGGAGGQAGQAGTAGSSGTGGTCLNCGGEAGSGGSGATGGDGGCTQTNGGNELCDGIDNDCDGEIDEDFDLSSDIRNCGVCGNDCTVIVLGAEQATCTATPGTEGDCGYTTCTADYFDLNGDPTDGCEYYCVKKSDTDLTCDNVDDNCDGVIDDGVDFCTDANNCGRCGRNCQGKAHATGQCVPEGSPSSCDETNTQCELAACDPGWIDANKTFADGCEYACTKTKRTDPNDPNTLVECEPNEVCDREYCDGVDNDCDGDIDGLDADLYDPTNGDPSLNQTCTGGNQGECAKSYHEGITRCIAAQVRCVNDNTGSTTCTSDSECTDASTPYCVDSATAGTKVCGTKVLRVNDDPEICDGLDNNCDGEVDNSPTDAGGACGSNTGLCTNGTFICTAGELVCSGAVVPTQEVCNGADNDCDGVIDGTTTSVPVPCQSDTDCQALPTAKYCMTSSLTGGKVCAQQPANIVNAQNNPIPCQVPPAPPTGWTSACQAGTLACVSGVTICDGAITSTASQDVCGEDLNCDGVKSPDFNTDTDVNNCGQCGNACAGGHINWVCNAGTCEPNPDNQCMPGYIDCDGNPNDCERACDFLSNQELCNGVDDNCNCVTDEVQSTQYPDGIVTPSVTQVCGIGAAATGVCLTGTSVSCNAGDWVCSYPAGHCDQGSPASCSATPDICDGLDNNCNGNTDENFKPPVLNQGYIGQACASDDNLTPKHGLCQQTGTYQCDGTASTSCQDGSGSTIAGVALPCGTSPGESGYPCEEACDGLDNDCDGVVDEPVRDKGPNDQYWVKPAVVKLGIQDVWMFRYEASRPGATNTTPGTGNGWWRSSSPLVNQPLPASGTTTTLDKTPACSAPSKVPWFNISGREAQHVCTEMGGRLCQNSEWQNACRSGSSTCSWSFAADCNVFTPSTNWTTCNLAPYDFDDQTAGNQDGLLPTGYLTDCWANWSTLGRINDLTGNLRELTCPGSTACTSDPSNFVLMGGAFNTADPSGEGAACDFTFYNVDDQFKLFDVGFRCCFDSDPTI